MLRIRNVPKNRGRCCGRKTCAPGGCDSARPRAELHVPGIQELWLRRDVVALQEGITLGLGGPEVGVAAS